MNHCSHHQFRTQGTRLSAPGYEYCSTSAALFCELPAEDPTAMHAIVDGHDTLFRVLD